MHKISGTKIGNDILGSHYIESSKESSDIVFQTAIITTHLISKFLDTRSEFSSGMKIIIEDDNWLFPDLLQTVQKKNLVNPLYKHNLFLFILGNSSY